MRTPILLVLAFVMTLASLPATAGEGDAATAFDRLKPLVGTWEGKGPDGSTATVTYRLVSNGTALMEELSVEGMVTMYYPDGDAVMLTHYCAGNNQPRMRAVRPKAGDPSLKFAFQDITNLADPEAEYMSDVTLTFLDANHFRQEWTSVKAGQRNVMTVDWARVN